MGGRGNSPTTGGGGGGTWGALCSSEFVLGTAKGEHLPVAACRKPCPLPGDSCRQRCGGRQLGTSSGSHHSCTPTLESLRGAGWAPHQCPARLCQPRRGGGVVGRMGSHPPGGCHRVRGRQEDRHTGWGCCGGTTRMPCARVGPCTPAHSQAPTQDTLAHGVPPMVPMAPPLPHLLSAPGMALHRHCLHTASAARCQQLPAPPAPTVGHGPCHTHGGGMACEMPGLPSAIPWWDLQRDPCGCCGQGVHTETETGEVEGGLGPRGALRGQGTGAFPSRGAPPAPLDPAPSTPACSIERGDKAGERGWPHSGGCHHQAPQVSL